VGSRFVNVWLWEHEVFFVDSFPMNITLIWVNMVRCRPGQPGDVDITITPEEMEGLDEGGLKALYEQKVRDLLFSRHACLCCVCVRMCVSLFQCSSVQNGVKHGEPQQMK